MKIFIASSGRSKLLAESLASQLKSGAREVNLQVDVVAWFRDAFPPSEDTLSSLLAHCGGGANISPADFFAVLLTKDDDIIREGDKVGTPRDNCIFELGLFIGALGLEPRRCFMISSVGEKSLPSDLKGRTLIRFDEPADICDSGERRKAMAKPAREIRNKIQLYGKYIGPELKPTTLDDLMMREAHEEDDGALSKSSHVIVGIEQSFAGECRRASQLLRNLMAGIEYKYFVSNPDPTNDIARLIKALAIANPSGSGNIDDADKHPILQNLMLLQKGLSINVSPGHVPFGFRIHIVSDLDKATCYVRQPNGQKYFEWIRDRDAFELARVLRSIAPSDEDLDPIYVIRPTNLFDFQSPKNTLYLDRIKTAVARAFGADLRDDVERICFGTVSKSHGAGAP